MDLSLTGMETPYPEPRHCRAFTANLLSVAHTGSLQQVSPLPVGLYIADSLFLMALHRTVQGGKTRLKEMKN